MAVLSLSLGATSASAQTTLLTETFSGSGSTSLVGTTTGDGNSWTGSSTILDDGSLTGSNYKSAYLSLGGAVASGATYTIDISYTNNGNGNNNEPLRVGLAVAALDNNGNADGGGQRAGGPAFDIFVDGEGDVRTYPDSTGSQTYDSRNTPAPTSLSIVLDTTNASDYTVSFFNGATQLGSTEALGSAIAFDTLWIGHERANGALNFNSITVTTTAGADTTEPEIDTLSPANNSSSAAVDGDLVMTFDETVQAGTGTITITETGVGPFETIPVPDARVQFSGCPVQRRCGGDHQPERHHAQQHRLPCRDQFHGHQGSRRQLL